MSIEKNKKKILIVDDDATQVKLLEDILTKKNFSVISTTEADRGLQLAMSESPDFIISDIAGKFCCVGDITKANKYIAGYCKKY